MGTGISLSDQAGTGISLIRRVQASLVRRAGTLIARFAGTIESRTDEELQGTPPSWFLDPQKANSASFTTNNFFHGAVSGGVNTAESIMVDDNSRKQ